MTKGDRLYASANTMFIISMINLVAGFTLAFVIGIVGYVLLAVAAGLEDRKNR
jgi:hypothetical protein